jgi:hypothetical protein
MRPAAGALNPAELSQLLLILGTGEIKSTNWIDQSEGAK